MFLLRDLETWSKATHIHTHVHMYCWRERERERVGPETPMFLVLYSFLWLSPLLNFFIKPLFISLILSSIITTQLSSSPSLSLCFSLDISRVSWGTNTERERDIKIYIFRNPRFYNLESKGKGAFSFEGNVVWLEDSGSLYSCWIFFDLIIELNLQISDLTRVLASSDQASFPPIVAPDFFLLLNLGFQIPWMNPC